jgi:replicative DNA helicase
MDNSQLKMPPHSLDAEQSVIGAVLIDNQALDIIYNLKPSQFYSHNHSIIYQAICDLSQEQREIDVLTLAERIDQKGKLAEIGGIAYLGGIVQNTASASNVKRYAEIVAEKAIMRALIHATTEIQNDIYNFGEVSGKLERAQHAIMAITETIHNTEPQFVGDLIDGRLERYEQVMEGSVKTIGTGLRDLDGKIGGGLEAGQLVIVAARPAMGKTALAVQFAQHIQNKDAAALVFTCEMTNAQIVDRLISSIAKLPSDKLRNGEFTDDDLNRLTHGAGTVKGLNMLVDDKSHTLNSIASKARSCKRKHGLSVIVVDYLQLLEGIGDIREQQIASISRGLKKLAIELSIPVIALSQLNRKLEDRGDKRPMMSDLRESGAIEQDADIIMFIYRDEVYNSNTIDKGTAEIIIAKNRNGETGRLRTIFQGEFTRFYDFEGVHFMPKIEEKKTYKRGFD